MSEPLAPLPGAAPGNVEPVNISGAPSDHTKLVARTNTAAGDPAAMPHAQTQYAPRERTGAQYGIQVGFEAHPEPSAGLTLANGRLFKPAINRSAPNFYMGAEDHN